MNGIHNEPKSKVKNNGVNGTKEGEEGTGGEFTSMSESEEEFGDEIGGRGEGITEIEIDGIERSSWEAWRNKKRAERRSLKGRDGWHYVKRTASGAALRDSGETIGEA